MKFREGLLTALVPGPHDPVLGAGVHGLGCGEHGRVLDLLDGCGHPRLPGGRPHHPSVPGHGGKEGEEGKQERGHDAATEFLRPLMDTSISVSLSIHSQGFQIEYKHNTSVVSLADDGTFNTQCI